MGSHLSSIQAMVSDSSFSFFFSLFCFNRGRLPVKNSVLECLYHKMKQKDKQNRDMQRGTASFFLLHILWAINTIDKIEIILNGSLYMYIVIIKFRKYSPTALFHYHHQYIRHFYCFLVTNYYCYCGSIHCRL